MKPNKIEKIFGFIPLEDANRCLKFAKQNPPSIEHIEDKDIESDLILRSADNTIARVQVYRLLETNKDNNPSYTFHLSLHEISQKGKITDIGTFSQEKLISILQKNISEKEEEINNVTM